MTRLRTRPSRDHGDVAAFFDACAPSYREQHGNAEKLLAYRLGLLRGAARLTADDAVLEIGCGPGLHLLALAGEIGGGVGVDLSPAMIATARQRSIEDALAERFSFEVDAAERLDTVGDASVDVVFIVGALEHMLDQETVLRQVFRVLKPGGRFACLTLNGGSLWYRHLAPRLGYDTRQLSTDHYLTRRELLDFVRAAGFESLSIDFWTFVQRGDIPRSVEILLEIFDHFGRLLWGNALRGGLCLGAVKPADSSDRLGSVQTD